MAVRYASMTMLPRFLDLIESADTPAARISRALARRGQATASVLVADTGLSRSVVSSTLTALRGSDVVLDMDTRQTGMGRPTLVHGLNPKLGVGAGILLGLEEIRVSLCDVTHSFLIDESVPVARDYSPEMAADVVRATLTRHCTSLGITIADLIGVGFAVSAPVSPKGVILAGSILPRWHGISVGELFGPALGCPIHAENESNCGALAELMWGAAQGEDDFLMVKFDLGIGGAIIRHGEVDRGAWGAAGEFGHITLDPRGTICRCGNRGCLETFAGGALLTRQAETFVGHPVTMNELVEGAEKGKGGFRRLLEDAADMAGWGLGLIGTVLNPPMFLLAGGLAQSQALFNTRLQESYRRHTMHFPDPSLEPRFVQGKFLSNDTVLGGMSMVLRQEARVF